MPWLPVAGCRSPVQPCGERLVRNLLFIHNVVWDTFVIFNDTLFVAVSPTLLYCTRLLLPVCFVIELDRLGVDCFLHFLLIRHA
jgi:hypothetical protein